MTDRNYFKGKRIALVGLGPHGEMVEDARFLIREGALLSVYDLRSEARIKNHLLLLRSIGLANYVCGYIPASDLIDSELIILSQEYPRNSSFLSKIAEKGVQIEYPETLFFKLAPPLTLVGVIGNVGKTSVISMLAPMLKFACEKDDSQTGGGQILFVADTENGAGILPFLRKAKNGDILLMPIEGRMIHEFIKMRISPHVAIFTSLPHGFEVSPFGILEHQTYNNFLIASDEIIDKTRSFGFKPRAKMLRTKTSVIPPVWDLHFHGHDLMNAALALQAAKLFKVDDEEAEEVILDWKPLKGRIELVKKLKGVEYYNDTASRLPQSTLAALRILSKNKNVILICGGGATGADYSLLFDSIPEYVHTLILLPGSGTLEHRGKMEKMKDVRIISSPGIEEAVRLARENARLGDKILFSPAFAALSSDLAGKERGEKFVRAVRTL